jgi:hypothetical protein
MRPAGELASSGDCLAADGEEYLVYLPDEHGSLRQFAGSVLPDLFSEQAEVNLSGAAGPFSVEWIDVNRGLIVPGASVSGGDTLRFVAPFAGDAVLHLKSLLSPTADAGATIGARADAGAVN